MINWTFSFSKLRFDLIASLTYLIPCSQDLIKSFPHDKFVAIADDNVHQSHECFWIYAS